MMTDLSRESAARFADHDPLVMSDPPLRPRRWPVVVVGAGLVLAVLALAVWGC